MIVHVKFETEVPDGISFKDIEEWIAFELKSGDLKVSNPLANKELTARFIGVSTY